jgi:NADPH-dependent 2,4-dienoyl-CoA reductase/sulfur reductase-like enzyme
MAHKTTDGYSWEKRTGVVRGLNTDAVVTPQRASVNASSKVYDVVVIGAGYAGLCAARDLSALRRAVLQSPDPASAD